MSLLEKLKQWFNDKLAIPLSPSHEITPLPALSPANESLPVKDTSPSADWLKPLPKESHEVYNAVLKLLSERFGDSLKTTPGKHPEKPHSLTESEQEQFLRVCKWNEKRWAKYRRDIKRDPELRRGGPDYSPDDKSVDAQLHHLLRGWKLNGVDGVFNGKTVRPDDVPAIYKRLAAKEAKTKSPRTKHPLKPVKRKTKPKK